jgi:type IV pilus assembly protein PilY1
VKTLLFALALAAALSAAPLVMPGGQARTASAQRDSGQDAKPIACPPSVGSGRLPGRSTAAMRQDGAGVVIESGHDETGLTGWLEMRALSTGADGGIAIGAAPLWEAGAVLAGHTAPRERKLYTMLRNADGSTASVPFTWDQLGAEERAWLDRAPSAESPDGLGEARVAFLRGERDREVGQPGGIFRRRDGILGDAVHGMPLLVGAPSPSVQGPGYAAFHDLFKSRGETVYLGTNDGMLHAFDARDGTELFAYVPNALIPALNQLCDPEYRHRPYVDASAGEAEALLNGKWRSVLVSGMGMGASGVFALDVSDPAVFDGGQRALWEFTERDDPAIGHVSAAPQVAKIKVALKAGVPEYRYFALMPGGAALFLLALDKPPTEPWRRNLNYYKLPAAATGTVNALGQPALVTATDGSVRFAYAGDSQGTLWRFDFSGKPPFSSDSLFEARDEAGLRQSVTHAPRVAFAPGGGYLVLFGTGTVIEDREPPAANLAPQSFYALRDSAARPPVPVNGRADLVKRTFLGAAPYTIKGDEFDYAGPGAKKGWYFDFPNARSEGERLAATPLLAAGTVIVSTIAPGADPCAAATTRTYVLDVLTGFALPGDRVSGQPLKTATGALPLMLELGAFTGSRSATGGAGAIRKIGIVHLQGEGAAPEVQQVDVTLPARRISWREVANWQELHDAVKK